MRGEGSSVIFGRTTLLWSWNSAPCFVSLSDCLTVSTKGTAVLDEGMRFTRACLAMVPGSVDSLSMLWRALTAILLLFWAVMTGLLMRTVYFPEQSVLAEVPVRMVLDLFLNQTEAHSNTLHLYHHDKRLGHASFQVVRNDKVKEDKPLYRLTVSGGLDAEGEPGRRLAAGWRTEADLRDGVDLEALNLDLTAAESERTVMLKWVKGQELPVMEVRQGSRVVMDTKGALAMAGLGEQMGLFGGLLGVNKPGGGAPQVSLEAREGLMDLAGRGRRCFVVRLKFFDTYEVQALFTEVGELARVDLPHGFSLKEPLIHGLEPDLVEN